MSAQWYGSSCLNSVCCVTALLNKQGPDCLVAVAAMRTDISIVVAGLCLYLALLIQHWLGTWLVTPTLMRLLPLSRAVGRSNVGWLQGQSLTHRNLAYVVACITHWRMLSDE